MSEEHALFNSILLHGTRVCIMLDDDATARAYAIARQLCRYNIDVRLALLEKHHDPGSMTKEEVVAALASAPKWTWEDQIKEKISRVVLSKHTLL